jgi:hypothetical protein
MHDEPAAAPDTSQPAVRPKTAVVVIHGMGEQRPLETLRALVAALWTRDRDITGPRTAAIYSKPDQITGSFELRRITTRNVPLENGQEKRADFFEFYWAHLMTGNTVRSVAGWLVNLLVRSPATVPRRLLFPWAAGLVLLIGTSLIMALAGVKPELLQDFGIRAPPRWFGGVVAVASALLGVFFANWLAPVAGDAARYLSPTPGNVEARQTIREAGVDLLGKLHASGNYDRIVVVGHSLGSVIGYDVLNYAWGRLPAATLMNAHGKGSPALKAMADLEKAAGALLHAAAAERGAARAAYRAAQRIYQLELARPQADGKPVWLVSDYVSLGCPLSKADVLLGKDAEDLKARMRLREAPTCPPCLEKDDPKQKRFRFSYPIDEPVRIPHHAAVFAPVVWTNVYFPSVLIAFGDAISGRVAPLLGRGVLDVRLRIGGPFFRHMDYWKDPGSEPPRPWLRALRRGVNLKLLADAALWAAQATSDEVMGDALDARIGAGRDGDGAPSAPA